MVEFEKFEKVTDVDSAVNKLINGETVVILNDNLRKQVRTRLREIKKNCTIVLSQMNDKNF